MKTLQEEYLLEIRLEQRVALLKSPFIRYLPCKSFTLLLTISRVEKSASFRRFGPIWERIFRERGELTTCMHMVC